MRVLLMLLALTYLAACSVGASDQSKPLVEYLPAPGTEEMDLPYTAAVRLDNTLYLSGALGIVPGTRALAEGGIQPETKQTLENIAKTLENSGSSIDNVVKCTVFLADVAEWGAMNEVYTTFFDNKPARTAIGVGGLPLNARLEVECIAWVD